MMSERKILALATLAMVLGGCGNAGIWCPRRWPFAVIESEFLPIFFFDLA